jgi:hypothetical protein
VDRFIVGTGRCGSTLLSRMLAENPAVLSVFEFFNGLDVQRRFRPEPVPGAELADLISAEQPFLTAVMRRGYEVPEVIYPFGEGARYRRGDPLPWALVGMLPRLSPDPDRLYDEVIAFARALPSQPLAAHYHALFDWLAARLGRGFWIERSGSSIDYLGALVDLFPAARFVHIHRDGPEAALSMREHHAYRLPISVMYDVPVDGGERVSQLGPLALHEAPRADDAISRILASRPPAEFFGRYWTDQLVRGFGALPRIHADRYLAVRFEDLIDKPREVLAAIGDFFAFGADRDGWTARAAGLVRSAPPARFGSLAADERAALAQACRVGRGLLGRPT